MNGVSGVGPRGDRSFLLFGLEQSFDLIGEELVKDRASFGKDAAGDAITAFDLKTKDDTVAAHAQPAPAGEFTFELLEVALLLLQLE